MHKFNIYIQLSSTFHFGNCREGHSTSHALTVLCNKLYEALDKGHYALGIFLDFSKAFDTINHAILLKKTRILWNKGNSLKMA